MGLEADIKDLKIRSESEYQDYKRQLGIKMKEYNDKCSEFDVLIGTINSERFSFRKEIRVLYDFLQSIGGSLKEEKKISAFEFLDEAPAPNQLYVEILGLTAPDFREVDGFDWLYKGILGISRDHFKNKEMYKNFCIAVENKKKEYEKDLKDRATQISYMEDAIKIAKVYRNVIASVRDTVSEKILPELDMIQAFLYADAIREIILDGEKPEYVEPCGISEYKGTRQDIHYQFVKNTFDFYK